jgi:hypothetical protein
LCQKATFALQQIFLFDQLVGKRQQSVRNFEANGLGGPEIGGSVPAGIHPNSLMQALRIMRSSERDMASLCE